MEKSLIIKQTLVGNVINYYNYDNFAKYSLTAISFDHAVLEKTVRSTSNTFSNTDSHYVKVCCPLCTVHKRMDAPMLVVIVRIDNARLKYTRTSIGSALHQLQPKVNFDTRFGLSSF